jgi:hypothetical protein
MKKQVKSLKELSIPIEELEKLSDIVYETPPEYEDYRNTLLANFAYEHKVAFQRNPHSYPANTQQVLISIIDALLKRIDAIITEYPEQDSI